MKSHAALGLALAALVPSVAGVPVRQDAPREVDIKIEATAYLDLDLLADKLKHSGKSQKGNHWDGAGPQQNNGKDEGHVQLPPQEKYVTLTIPGPKVSPVPEPTTRFPEPGCDRCFGTVFHYKPEDKAFETVNVEGSGPYPAVSTKEAECLKCRPKVNVYMPQQPKGGFPAPARVTVSLDGAGPNGPKVTLPPVLPLDSEIVVHGKPGFEKHIPTYKAKGADPDSERRTVMALGPVKEPVVIVGHSQAMKEKDGEAPPELSPCFDCGEDGEGEDRHNGSEGEGREHRWDTWDGEEGEEGEEGHHGDQGEPQQREGAGFGDGGEEYYPPPPPPPRPHHHHKHKHHHVRPHHPRVTIPPFQPGAPPIIFNINAGNNNGNANGNGNGNSHVTAGNGNGNGNGAEVHAGNGNGAHVTAGNGISSNSNSGGNTMGQTNTQQTNQTNTQQSNSTLTNGVAVNQTGIQGQATNQNQTGIQGQNTNQTAQQGQAVNQTGIQGTNQGVNQTGIQGQTNNQTGIQGQATNQNQTGIQGTNQGVNQTGIQGQANNQTGTQGSSQGTFQSSSQRNNQTGSLNSNQANNQTGTQGQVNNQSNNQSANAQAAAFGPFGMPSNGTKPGGFVPFFPFPPLPPLPPVTVTVTVNPAPTVS